MQLRKIFKTAVLGLALTASFAGMTGCTSYNEAKKDGFYSEGDRVGTVTKISHKGIRSACKTWEGELAMDNFKSTGDNSTSNTFAFTVKDPDVLKQVQAAQDSGGRVKLHYNQILMQVPCESDTGYFITSATPVNPAPPALPGPGR